MNLRSSTKRNCRSRGRKFTKAGAERIARVVVGVGDSGEEAEQDYDGAHQEDYSNLIRDNGMPEGRSCAQSDKGDQLFKSLDDVTSLQTEDICFIKVC